MVHTQGRRREKAEHVEVARTIARIDEAHALRPVKIENEIEAVDKQRFAKHAENAIGCDRQPGWRDRHSSRVGTSAWSALVESLENDGAASLHVGLRPDALEELLEVTW